MVEMCDYISEFESTWIEFPYSEKQKTYRLKKSEQNLQVLGTEAKEPIFVYHLCLIIRKERPWSEGIWNT